MSSSFAATEHAHEAGSASGFPRNGGTDHPPTTTRGQAQVTDEEFVRELTQRFGSGLFSFVLTMTKDRGWAEDIVQATLIRAWRSRDRLADGGDSARIWLYTVAKRILIDDYRARTARPAVLGADLHAVAEHTNDIDRLVSSLTIRQALASLTEAHRQAVVLSLLRHHTTAETAAILGISEGTVKSRLHYGIRALRKALEESGFGATRGEVLSTAS